MFKCLGHRKASEWVKNAENWSSGANNKTNNDNINNNDANNHCFKES